MTTEKTNAYDNDANAGDNLEEDGTEDDDDEHGRSPLQ